ncbi:hypothetical protein AB0C24_14090 [Amycolatopsis japonica]|uniref:hypothetical protein n=1 Tax=Amycolatopsis japonica TaxID=208439 RepID=UPI0033CAB75A
MLKIASRPPGAHLTVLDSEFRQIIDTVGEVRQRVPVGVYQVTAQIGRHSATRIVFVPPGIQAEPTILTVEFTPPSPVEGSPDPHGHGKLVNEQSVNLAQDAGPNSGLLLVLRHQDDTTFHPDASGLELLTQRLDRLTPRLDWTDEETITQAGIRLPAGGYVLRSTGGPQNADASKDQTLWLSAGWQTVVFIPWSNDGPEVEALSIHMARLDAKGWEPDEPSNIVAELALADLRTGTPTATATMLEDKDIADSRNPLAQVFAAHALVARAESLSTIRPDILPALAALAELVGEHPDLTALVALHANQEGLKSWISVLWPPMLTASYRRCLLPVDRDESTVLPAGSPAEQVAAFADYTSPWLRWTSSPEIAVFPPAESARRTRHERNVPAAAVTRVLAYLREVADFEGISITEAAAAIGDFELSRRLRYPMTLVNAVLRSAVTDEPHSPALSISRHRRQRS